MRVFFGTLSNVEEIIIADFTGCYKLVRKFFEERECNVLKI